MSELPIRLQQLYSALLSQGDVSISHLCAAIDLADDKLAQQRLGSYITRLNRRIRKRGLGVVPGDRKRTYRLVVL